MVQAGWDGCGAKKLFGLVRELASVCSFVQSLAEGWDVDFESRCCPNKVARFESQIFLQALIHFLYSTYTRQEKLSCHTKTSTNRL